MALTDPEIVARGYDLPVGTDWVRDGDNNISKNARTTANALHDIEENLLGDAGALRVRGTLPPEITSLDQLNSRSWNGLWHLSANNGVTDVPFDLGGGAALVEVLIGSSATGGAVASVQRVTAGSQSYWREANFAGGTVTSWWPWRKVVHSGDFEGVSRVRGEIPEEITSLDELNTQAWNGAWALASGHSVGEVPFILTQGSLVEVTVGSPATAAKQVITDRYQSWWREAAYALANEVTVWGPWHQTASVQEIKNDFYGTAETLTESSDINLLPPGDYRVYNNRIAGELGLPTGIAGRLEVRVNAVSYGRMQTFYPWMPGGALPSQVWIRSGWDDGTYSHWTRIGGGIVESDIEKIRVTTNPAEVGGPNELLIVVE